MSNKDKRGQKEEKEGRGFGKLPSFFFPPFLLISHNRLRHFFWSKFGRFLLYCEGLNIFEFFKFYDQTNLFG